MDAVANQDPGLIRGTGLGDSPVPLSVLDLAPVGVEITPAQALGTTTELARSVERWGYHRFWVAEDHGMPGIVSSSPAIVIGHLASATSTLRVGSGGVLLPNHPPLVVAEQFGTLQALHPGRATWGSDVPPAPISRPPAPFAARADRSRGTTSPSSSGS